MEISFNNVINNISNIESVNSHPIMVQVGAIAGNANNATNLNYVIIGLAVVIVALIIITLIGNRK